MGDVFEILSNLQTFLRLSSEYVQSLLVVKIVVIALSSASSVSVFGIFILILILILTSDKGLTGTRYPPVA